MYKYRRSKSDQESGGVKPFTAIQNMMGQWVESKQARKLQDAQAEKLTSLKALKLKS